MVDSVDVTVRWIGVVSVDDSPVGDENAHEDVDVVCSADNSGRDDVVGCADDVSSTCVGDEDVDVVDDERSAVDS